MNYIVMHETEAGFKSVHEAQRWIDHTYPEEKSRFRVVPLAEDDTVNKLVAEERSREVDAAYLRGMEMARKLLRLQLGLAVPGDRI